MRIIVIAGPNGAGKSTLAAEYLKREGARRPFVNGDDIAAKLNPRDPAAAALEAGRIALRQMEAHVASAGTSTRPGRQPTGRAHTNRPGDHT